MAGSSDRNVLEAARNEGRVLLTLDKGIGDIRVFGRY